MRSCCVFDSLRLLHFPLFAFHLLFCHPVFPPAHQRHLPRCGEQIPCALPKMRTSCRVRPSHRFCLNKEIVFNAKYASNIKDQPIHFVLVEACYKHCRGGQEAGRATNQRSIHHVRLRKSTQMGSTLCRNRR